MEIVKQKILLVDDDHAQRQLLEFSLRGPGRIFRHAADGDAALELAVLETPDIILTDHHMPVSGSHSQFIGTRQPGRQTIPWGHSAW